MRYHSPSRRHRERPATLSGPCGSLGTSAPTFRGELSSGSASAMRLLSKSTRAHFSSRMARTRAPVPSIRMIAKATCGPPAPAIRSRACSRVRGRSFGAGFGGRSVCRERTHAPRIGNPGTAVNVEMSAGVACAFLRTAPTAPRWGQMCTLLTPPAFNFPMKSAPRPLLRPEKACAPLRNRPPARPSPSRHSGPARAPCGPRVLSAAPVPPPPAALPRPRPVPARPPPGSALLSPCPRPYICSGVPAGA